MESLINLYTYTEKKEQAERSREISHSLRNIVEFEQHFDRFNHSEWEHAESTISQLKAQLLNVLLTRYSFYWFGHDYVNRHKSITNMKLGRKIDSDQLTFLNKLYTIPELDLTLGARIERWIPDPNMASNHSRIPNLLYLHQRSDLVSESTVDSFMKVYIENAFETKKVDPLLQFEFEFLLVAFLDHTKLRLIQLRKGNVDVLVKCHIEMLEFSNSVKTK